MQQCLSYQHMWHQHLENVCMLNQVIETDHSLAGEFLIQNTECSQRWLGHMNCYQSKLLCEQLNLYYMYQVSSIPSNRYTIAVISFIPCLEYPIWEQTTPASVSSQESSQTVLQTPFRHTSKRPSRIFEPLTSLNSQFVEQTFRVKVYVYKERSLHRTKIVNPDIKITLWCHYSLV